jgi:hypothetical protein
MKYFLILLISVAFLSCKKTWVAPDIYTVNLTLAITPDSSDEVNKIYYYSSGMIVQLKLSIQEGGSTVIDEVWNHQKNYHFGDTLENPNITGTVIKLDSDTSLHLESYPLYMAVNMNTVNLFEKIDVVCNYNLE